MLVTVIVLLSLGSIIEAEDIKWMETSNKNETSLVKWANNCDYHLMYSGPHQYYEASEDKCVRRCLESEKCVGFRWDKKTGICYEGDSFPFFIIADVGYSCGFKPKEARKICLKHLEEDAKLDWKEGHKGVTWAPNCYYKTFRRGQEHQNQSRDECAELCKRNRMCHSFNWNNDVCYLCESISFPVAKNTTVWCGYPTNRLRAACDDYVRGDEVSTPTIPTLAKTVQPSQDMDGGVTFQASVSSVVVVAVLIALVLLVSLLVFYFLRYGPYKKVNANNAAETELTTVLAPPSYEQGAK